MSKSKREQIKMALFNAIPENKALDLGKDTFLTGPELDGSDKIYGFFKSDGKIYVVSRSSSSGYPLSDIDDDDINYMIPGILQKIKDNAYSLVEIGDL